LSQCAEGPEGRLHGDAVPANFLTRRGEDVVAVDWQCFGTGPVGADLGYYALSVREEFDVLLDAYLDGVGPHADREAVAVAARVTAVYTVLSRAEWALAQAARGEGALAGKFRHPSVAPYLRALQRQFPQIEQLLT
jgi:aminoglycoside phosphotransferase (APT) family kinase protein